ncbi:hypothetical protein [Stenotrophomonas sp.]|uniref:hypothetical protein n=1 Tax=Stenotrophomonas sp. TaxID=69392 RepID=UPI00289FFBA0|nr:hypothetical protein [Stenotrophomonas sp.]
MSDNTLTAHSGYAGWFKIEALRVDEDGVEVPGSRRIAADWFPNLITNAGLDFLGTTGATLVYGFCRVGSGNTTPSATDTALVTPVAVSSTAQATANGVNRSGAFYAWRRQTTRFAAGAAAGTLAEVGVSPAGTGALFSRALILDGGGNPTTITVLSDEVLDVTYELRLYPTLADATGTVTIAAVSYNWIARPLIEAGYDFSWKDNVGYGVMPRTSNGSSLSPSVASNLPAQSATLVDGISAGALTALAYVAGTYARSFRFDSGLNDANVSGGIGCFFATGDPTAVQGMFGVWAWGLTPKLPKTAQTVATFTIRMSWGRYTP